MRWLTRLSLVLLALPLVGAGSCDADSPTAPDERDSGTSVTLPAEATMVVGETILVETLDVEVTFSAVTEDSRCPVDVDCVWAGRAVVALAIGESTGTTEEIQLEVGQSTQAQGLRLTATALDPQPREGVEIPPEDYRLELTLTRAGG